MRIGLISDTRLPTLPEGGHGLGRMAWDIIEGLTERGHTVTLYAGNYSQAPEGVALVKAGDEKDNAQAILDNPQHDAYIDLSHYHELSQLAPDMPVLNWIADIECRYFPPNAIVGGDWGAAQLPSARRVPLGIDVDRYPFVSKSEPYALYVARLHRLKGPDIAFEVAKRAGVQLVVMGSNIGGYEIPGEVAYMGPVDNNRAFNSWLCTAKVLLGTSRAEAGGRVILEAAACGVPTVCLDWTGQKDHVEHGVSGFVVRDPAEMVDALKDVALLDRARVRSWVKETHDRSTMVTALMGCVDDVVGGARW